VKGTDENGEESLEKGKEKEKEDDVGGEGPFSLVVPYEYDQNSPIVLFE